ncbi:MAG TPA: nucleotide disphospho-sugar-binding domain-containing protein [Acidimicrobiales bacterium]
MAAMVDETGHPFKVGGEPPESAVRPIREQLPIVPAGEASVLGNRDLFGRMATTAMLSSMDSVLRDWQPDVVLRDPCEYASAVAAAPIGIPTVTVAIGLAEVEWDATDVAAPALEAHRAGLVEELRRAPYLTRFPASLDPSPFPDTRRFSEPLAAPRGAVPDWWPGSSAPLVYMTFGTVLGHMTIASEVYRGALEAVSGIDARVLLTVGRKFDASQLDHVPDNVHVEAWVDQADVLGETALVLCHGGSGTTFGALAAGVPVVVVPLFADQFTNGTRVRQVGAGLLIDADRDAQGRRRPGGDDTRHIRDAVEAVLADSSYGESARAVAAEMAAAPTAKTTLEVLRRTR